MAGIDFNHISQSLLAQADKVLPQWFPNGRTRGNEFTIGDLDGNEGESLSINRVTGVWKDFASNEGGSDLVSLFAAVHQLGQGDAAKRLASEYGLPAGNGATPVTATRKQGPRLSAPPASAPMPSFVHRVHGRPTKVWTYRDRKGGVLYYISRHDPADGRKQFVPWSWDADAGRWCNRSQTKPRALYGLELLDARPDAPVLLVEGEKAADAARQIAGSKYVVMTWPGGSQACDCKIVDYQPLHGRKVVLWPDADNSQVYPRGHHRAGEVRDYADQPGPEAMLKISGYLHPHCKAVGIIDVSDVTQDKWDAADALDEGWDYQRFVAWAKPRMRITRDSKAVQEAAVTALASEAAATPAADNPGNLPEVSLYDLWNRFSLDRMGTGEPLANLNNVALVLEQDQQLRGLFWMDEFYGRVYTTWQQPEGSPPREWVEEDDTRLTLYLQRVMGLTKMHSRTVGEAVRMHAHNNVRNEPQEWLRSLKWDGIPRLASLLPVGMGTVDDEYNQRVGECFMTGMAARVLEPGCKLDNMPVLEGNQGVGKSSALNALVGDRWFAEASESPTSKDFFQCLKGKMLIEIGEMDAFNRSEKSTIKRVISCKRDRYRDSYGRYAKDNPRMCVFAGTTNHDDWQRDETGARRFWPVRCGRVNLQWIREHRTQLFAEAAHYYLEGRSWWDVPAEAALREQEARRPGDTWEDVVREWLDDRAGMGLYEFATQEILAEAIKLEVARQDRPSQMRLAGIMKQLGYENRKVRRGGVRLRMWVHESTPQE